MSKDMRLMMLAMLLLPFLVACRGESVNLIERPRALSDVPVAAWDALANKKIYFGHQSVGFNIVKGVEELMAEDPRIRLHIVESTDLAAFDGPVFAHYRVGSNRDPLSKNTAFSTFLLEGIGDQADLASFKYCYVDVTKDSDLPQIFAEYKATIKKIHAAFPELCYLHMTVPLQQAPISIKTKIKLLVGRGDLWEFDDNIARNRFNALLLEEYGGREPIFDLAKFESMRDDGSRESFTVRGHRVFSLMPEYTADGGHLNERGRRFVAEQFLVFLATL